MVKVLILTHGTLADTLYETVGLFIAERDGLEAIAMGEDTQAFRAKLTAALVESPEEHILLMVDLFGGTPFNMAASLLGETKARGKRVEIVSGVNLPMLLEVTANISSSTLEEIKNMAFEVGKYGIRDLLQELDAKRG